jgi:hypothetical protein
MSWTRQEQGHTIPAGTGLSRDGAGAHQSKSKEEQRFFLEKAVARSFASPVSEATCKHRTTGRKTMRMRYFSSNTDSFLVEAREQRE